MCTGKCSKFIGISLFPFSIICIIANILLLFPGFGVEAIQDAGSRMTPEVLYLGGIIGGGFLVLIPAIHILATGQRKNCCNNRCGMFLSIIFAAIGLVGAVYALTVSAFGMVYGPVCEFRNSTGALVWGQIFKDNIKNFSNESYLFNKDLWQLCEKPDNVAVFNISLFSIVLTASAIEIILCVVQVVNGLAGCLCGTCQKK
ncbi:transmembrane 4 L6 family member 5 [Xenopus laevis]|uniref:Transmembrane 4 L6 family member 5 n=2 Tax=Xenopus laevis TaxID=8355 RepID=A0A8J1MV24_XENLA|nr:transmembrane 4 L6 family member 5 [Xenopus laevis]OCT59442.1 hypothetical protein XELAEV_18000864mg [Xenopus laevis]